MINRRRFTALLGSTVFALLLAEGAARVWVGVSNSETLGNAAALRAAPPEDPLEISLGHIIQLSPNDNIVYELRPNLANVLFKGVPLTTNSQGFRSPELGPRAQGTLTVVGIGDSVMFGHGVGDGENYFDGLMQRMEEAHPERPWRYVNTGVPGYNTVMEVETLVTKGLAYEPDLVLLNIVPNDLAIPQYMRPEVDPWDLSRSYLYHLAWSLTPEGKAATGRLAREGLDPRLAHLNEFNVESRMVDFVESYEMDTVPARYRHLIGWDAYVGALDRLAALQREHGFEVILFTTVMTELSEKMVAEAMKRGWVHSALLPDIQQYMKAKGEGRFDIKNVNPYLQSSLVVSRSNAHPSTIQHAMGAERLHADLESSGILGRLLERPAR